MKLHSPGYKRHLAYTVLAAAMALGLAGCDDSSAPVANAGLSQTVTTGTTITFDGSGSTDADGDALTYKWTLTSQPAGSTATITNANTAKPTFIPDFPGTYTAKLTVSDGVNVSDATVTVTASDVVGFDWLPASLPFSYPSYGFESEGLTSLGDQVTLKAGSPNTMAAFEVVMVSWACQNGEWNNNCTTAAGTSFTHPVTVKFYNPAGALLATKTQTFTVPFRPTSDPTCADPTNYRNTAGGCSTGLAFKIAFDLHALRAAVPNTFYYEISYNTSHAGATPTGGAATEKYNALNVGAYYPITTAPTVGADPQAGIMRRNGADSNETAAIPAKVIMAAP